MTELRREMARTMTEDELLLAITEAATLTHWRWHHARRSDQALTMGAQGFPDLVLARAGRIMFLELKRQDGHVTSAQLAWMDALDPTDVGSWADSSWRDRDLLAGIVRPADLDAILELLR